MLEWYANGPLGLEQGFTLTRRPTGHGQVSLEMAISGSLTPRLNARGTTVSLVDGHGRPVLRYTGLRAIDAAGRVVPAWLGLSGHLLALHLNDRGARYPIRIDPYIQAAELTSGDSGGELGWSMAMSGDTIAAGAPTYPGGGNSVGAVYVFTKPANGWADMTSPTAKLTDSKSGLGDHLGESVGISGNTIVAGAHGNGYADVWVMPNGGWTSTSSPAATLTDSAISGNTGFGWAVAVSGDTVVVGDPAGQQAYVYVKPNTGWASESLPNATLSGGANAVTLGQSVAVSGDTVAVGDDGYRVGVSSQQEGAVLVYVKPNTITGWGTTGQNLGLGQTAVLTGPTVNYDFELGHSVAIDGGTIVAGAPLWQNGAATTVGAAYVFAKPNTGWASGTQTAVLTASDGGTGDQFGYSVGVSGSTIVVGDPQGFATPDHGAAYVFAEPNGGWVNATESQKLTASDTTTANLDFGWAVAIDGSTIAGSAYTSQDGRVYVFTTIPTCTWVGQGADNNWQTVANWSGCNGTFPGAGDNVVISAGGPSGLPDVTSADASARSIAVSGSAGFTVEAGRTLTVSTSGSSSFVGGHIVVSGTLAVGDPSTWAGGGGYAGGGTIKITSGALMTVDPGSGGIVELVPKLDNESTGPGAGVEIKTGTLQLDNGDAGTTTGSYAIDSGATLDAYNGSFDAPSVSGGGTFMLTHATVTIGAAQTFSPATLTLTGDGELTLNANTSIPNLNAGGSVRDGTGTLTVTASANFPAGEAQFKGGTTTIANTVSSPVVFGAGQLVLSNATLNLDAPAIWSGNQWTMQNASTLNVKSSLSIPSLSGGLGGDGTSVLDVGSGGSIAFNPGAGRELDIPFAKLDNAGTVTVSSGTLAANGGFTQSAGATTVASGAQLTGHVALNGGTLNGNGTLGGPVDNTGGTVAPGSSPGTLTDAGDYTQGAGGTLAEEITGTTQGTQYDHLVVDGALSLNGALAINSASFTPALTDAFKIISGATSHTGTFAALTGATVNGETYSAQYDSDGVTLVVSGPPPPPNQTLSVTFAGSGAGSVSDGASLNCAASCQHQYPQGTLVTLNAAAASGSSFAGWSGACSGTGGCQVTMSAAQNVTATFNTLPPPTQCVVPRLIGKKLGAAKIAIRSAHCGVGKVTMVKSTRKHRNRVLSQSPKPGEHLKQGAKVALKVGT